MKHSDHITMPVRVPDRSYAVGQKVRKYDSWFCHNDAVAGWYSEGVIEKIEPQAIRGSVVWFRVDKLVMYGREYPNSHRIGTLSCFHSDSGFVVLLKADPELVFTNSKPWWE